MLERVVDFCSPWQKRMLPYLRQVPNMLKARLEWQHICGFGEPNTHFTPQGRPFVIKYPYQTLKSRQRLFAFWMIWYAEDFEQFEWQHICAIGRANTHFTPQRAGLLRKSWNQDNSYSLSKWYGMQKNSNRAWVAAHLYHWRCQHTLLSSTPLPFEIRSVISI